MSSRGLTSIIAILCVSVTLAAGCARKVARPNVPQAPAVGGALGPQMGGSVAEGELQAVQANLKTVYFDYDSYALAPQAQTDLQYNAEVLRRAPQVSIVAEGHCDERGTAEYNLALGDRRARSVVDYLVGLGLSPKRFSTVSYGSELPVDPGHSEASWSKNRRVYLGVSN